jgi:hypothetical protein
MDSAIIILCMLAAFVSAPCCYALGIAREKLRKVDQRNDAMTQSSNDIGDLK